MFTTVMDTVKLTWGTSTDAQTPSKSLTYNVRIGTAPGASDILSANADLGTGKLRTQIGGNAGYNTSLSLQGLPNGTYYWQVQSVDNGFWGSMFSQEQQFEVTLSTVSNEGELEVPVTISLAQNYPNPFNPSTTISYSLQSPGNVNVQIFDITGRLVQVLVNERKTAGEHSVSFDASNLASGLYIYRLQTAGKIMTKKMTLIK
ncbi:MAG: T9SS type A sorting domain-containing protein [Balneola sp.]